VPNTQDNTQDLDEKKASTIDFTGKSNHVLVELYENAKNFRNRDLCRDLEAALFACENITSFDDGTIKMFWLKE
jgi:hypothetical protein